jgi:hypothetical protein
VIFQALGPALALTGDGAGRYTAGLDAYLFVNQVAVGVIRPSAAEGISLALYLYDLRTKFLLAEQSVTVGGGQDLVEEIERVAFALYDGVDLTGAVRAPDVLTGAEPAPSVLEQWWFWVGVGAVVASGIVAASVLATDDGVPDGWTRLEGTIQ